MCQVDLWFLELIICLLDFLKNDFREVDESMLQSVERLCELIFCILVIEYSALEEFP
jgi:hypothetical protein